MLIFNTLQRPANRLAVNRRQRKCWEIKNLSANEAEIRLYGEIGFWGIDAKQFTDELKAITAGTIHLRINSGGGDVFDGFAIHNAIADHPAHVIAHIDGLAASTASWIAMAANEVRMPKTAYLMIHLPIAGVYGDASELRKTAELLDKLHQTIAEIYADKSGGDVQTFLDAMTAETWYSGEEAHEAGLADLVEGEAQLSNAFDLSRYRNVPERLKNAGTRQTDRPDRPDNIRDFEALLRDVAGFSQNEAKRIAADGFDALHRDGANNTAKHRDGAAREAIKHLCSLYS